MGTAYVTRYKMGSEVLATHLILGVLYDVVGCYSEDTPEFEWDFFDVFEQTSGACLNEGNAFYEKPDRQDCVHLVKDYYGIKD